MKNKGRFEVLKKKDKYVIVYIEKGIPLDLSELDPTYSFDGHEMAELYVKDNKKALDNFVTDYKEEKQREIERRIAEEEAKKEEKRIRREEKERKKEEIKEKSRNFWYSWKGIVAAVVAAAITLTGGHFIAAGISKCAEKNKKPSTSQGALNNQTSSKEEPKYSYNYNNNVVIINDEEYKELTTEEFENITSIKVKELSDKGLNLSSEDIIKFMMIINCNKLAQDNKQLISQIVGEQTVDEVKQDAYKCVGSIIMYNYNIWYEEGSTKNFIKVSDCIFDEVSRNKFIEIENRVSEIALSSNDTEKFNQLVNELLRDLLDPTSELSYVESGVGLGLHIILEPIRGLYGDGLDLNDNKKLNETNLGLIMEFVPYAGDEEYRKENGMEEKNNDDTIFGLYIKNIDDILKDCPLYTRKLN